MKRQMTSFPKFCLLVAVFIGALLIAGGALLFLWSGDIHRTNVAASVALAALLIAVRIGGRVL